VVWRFVELPAIMRQSSYPNGLRSNIKSRGEQIPRNICFTCLGSKLPVFCTTYDTPYLVTHLLLHGVHVVGRVQYLERNTKLTTKLGEPLERKRDWAIKKDRTGRCEGQFRRLCNFRHNVCRECKPDLDFPRQHSGPTRCLIQFCDHFRDVRWRATTMHHKVFWGRTILPPERSLIPRKIAFGIFAKSWQQSCPYGSGIQSPHQV
jgi:hypothetical protein